MDQDRILGLELAVKALALMLRQEHAATIDAVIDGWQIRIAELELTHPRPSAGATREAVRHAIELVRGR